MEDRLYSIGEVSRIMGVSVQMLRHYCNMGIIAPEHINESTGYRYFSYNQFHYIDRTRYLLKCGFSLKEIQSILHSNDIGLLVQLLNRKKEEKLKNLRDTVDILSILDWYKDYFLTAKSANADSFYYVDHFPARTLVAIKLTENIAYDDFYILFNSIRSQPVFKGVQYKRQFVSVLDYDALLEQRFLQKYVGMVTVDPICFKAEHAVQLPEGNYYCFKAPILQGEWNQQIINMITADKPAPRIVLAAELEDNLTDFKNCLYEIQVLF